MVLEYICLHKQRDCPFSVAKISTRHSLGRSVEWYNDLRASGRGGKFRQGCATARAHPIGSRKSCRAAGGAAQDPSFPPHDTGTEPYRQWPGILRALSCDYGGHRVSRSGPRSSRFVAVGRLTRFRTRSPGAALCRPDPDRFEPASREARGGPSLFRSVRRSR